MLLHAITTTDGLPLGEAIVGMRGRPVASVEEGGLAAWVTLLDKLDSPMELTDLLAVHEIANSLHERLEGCLPARFPTWVQEGALRDDLRRRSAELSAALARVRGRSELAVTVRWVSPAEPEPPIRASTPGTRYLLERRMAFAGSDRQHQRAQQVAEEIASLVGQDLIEMRRTLCPSTGVALSAALLVPRARADELKALVSRTGPDVRILVNGPWPPYTFAALG